jgi:hypothetical protein
MSPQNQVSIWHKLYIYHNSPLFAPFDPVRRDVVHGSAPRPREPSIWDVALYLGKLNCTHEFDLFRFIIDLLTINYLGSNNDAHKKHGIHCKCVIYILTGTKSI